MYKVFFQTFGCKVNQTETASLVREFKRHGFITVSKSEDADVIFINTCTVTHRSDAKCRQAIRRNHKRNPEAVLIVGGCYSQVSPENIEQIEGVDYILGVQDKLKFFEYFEKPIKNKNPEIKVSRIKKIRKAYSREGDFLYRTRAFVKIQDGCSQKCSYCIVPFARGPGRSVPVDNILEQIESLISRGYGEIVLTGVHIGKYGSEKGQKDRLAELLEKVILLSGLLRIRLSSLDVKDISERLIDVVCGSEKICNHFHIPLQSGSDEILKKMRRDYTTGEYQKKIESIFSKFDSIGMGTDIITGFPGETDACFEETIRFISNIPFTYFHIFPFSLRKGTDAFLLKNRVDPGLCLKRAEELRKIGEIKKSKFLNIWPGRKVEVLFESRNNKGWLEGFSSEYLRVEVPFCDDLKGNLACVNVKNVNENILRGEVLDNNSN